MARPGNRIPSVTLYADKKEIKTAFGIATKVWICRTCQQEFSLLESMGALNCLQHPGFIQEDDKWSCCGKKLYPQRWSCQRPLTNLFDNKYTNYPTIPIVRGCQPCDHNTSDVPYTHKDAQSIGELSALLPFLNREFPFPLRKGFDEGVLRRCATRKIVVPPTAASVGYQDNDGNIATFDTHNDIVPEGIEIEAIDNNGQLIENWH